MMNPVVYSRAANGIAVVNPSALDELTCKNCTMPDIDRVIFNLSHEDIYETKTENTPDGKTVKTTVKTGKKRPVLATVMTFIDGTKVTVKNSITDEVDLEIKTLDDGTAVSVASDTAKERGVVFALFKRMFSKPDSKGVCANSATGRILRDIVAKAYDQQLHTAMVKVEKAKAKAEYNKRLNTAKAKKRQNYSINGTLARINELLDRATPETLKAVADTLTAANA